MAGANPEPLLKPYFFATFDESYDPKVDDDGEEEAQIKPLTSNTGDIDEKLQFRLKSGKYLFSRVARQLVIPLHPRNLDPESMKKEIKDSEDVIAIPDSPSKMGPRPSIFSDKESLFDRNTRSDLVASPFRPSLKELKKLDGDLQDIARPQPMYRKVMERAILLGRTFALLVDYYDAVIKSPETLSITESLPSIDTIPRSWKGSSHSDQEIRRNWIALPGEVRSEIDVKQPRKLTIDRLVMQIHRLHAVVEESVVCRCLIYNQCSRGVADAGSVLGAAILMLSCSNAWVKWEGLRREDPLRGVCVIQGQTELPLQSRKDDAKNTDQDEMRAKMRDNFCHYVGQLSDQNMTTRDALVNIKLNYTDDLQDEDLVKFQPVSEEAMQVMRYTKTHMEQGKRDLTSKEIIGEHDSRFDGPFERTENTWTSPPSRLNISSTSDDVKETTNVTDQI